MVRAALTEGRPYAAIFVDMRMPGWDGVETVQHLREIDREAEVVFVTAFSDSSIEEIVERAGPNVGYHLKPFAPEEIKQIATKAVYDWNKLRRLERLIHMIGTLKVNSTELDALLDHVFHQVASWIGTDSALLARRTSDRRFEKVLATGSLRLESAASGCLERLVELADKPDTVFDPGFICFRFERYNLFALLERSARMNSEKLYLLELFTKHAGQAIENLRLHETVMRAEKLAALGLAIGKIAHDMRSPIAAIQSAIVALREGTADSSFLREMLNLMFDSSEEALALASDLLSFTRNAAAQPAPIRTVDLLQALRRRMSEDLHRLGIALHMESKDVESFVGDTTKLQRALLNLLQNAAEALQSSGASLPTIQLQIRRDGENIIIEVIDNGPGIPAPLITTLFEPFTTFGKSGGTGLGLAIVHQAVQAHGGSVDFSTSETGTRFIISLPQEKETARVPDSSLVETLAVA